MIWLASQTSWLKFFSEPSRASLLACLYNEPSLAVTSRASSLSSLSCRDVTQVPRSQHPPNSFTDKFKHTCLALIMAV